MTLKEICRDYIGEARDAISWIAIWKVGRSWFASSVWPEECSDNEGPVFSKNDTDWLRLIHETDCRSILVNAYYCNIGPLEEMTLKTLEDGIYASYVLNRHQVSLHI